MSDTPQCPARLLLVGCSSCYKFVSDPHTGHSLVLFLLWSWTCLGKDLAPQTPRNGTVRVSRFSSVKHSFAKLLQDNALMWWAPDAQLPAGGALAMVVDVSDSTCSTRQTSSENNF